VVILRMQEFSVHLILVHLILQQAHPQKLNHQIVLPTKCAMQKHGIGMKAENVYLLSTTYLLLLGLMVITLRVGQCHQQQPRS